MNTSYPENVINKILQITLDSKKFAFLSIDQDGIVISTGGKLSAMGLPDWVMGENIRDEALFLHGFFPMENPYDCISDVQTNNKTVIDIHLFQDKDSCWLILVDKTDEMNWQALARQKDNELRLIKEEMNRYEAPEQPTDVIATQYELCDALSMLVLKRNDDGSFELLNPPSKRFEGVFVCKLTPDEPIYPQQNFAFIENFLIDAEELWQRDIEGERMRSGPWIEKNSADIEIALEAIALTWNNKQLLFIEILDESYEINHELLQIGREGMLLKNFLEQEVRRQTHEIRSREEEIALRLVCAADTRDDGETGSHIRRLGLYSELMAKNLDWSEAQCEEIRIAAPMHDIGKIGIPDSILKKPGKLTEEEFEIMKSHPEIGARILSNSQSSLVQMAREISLGHHEKWDGSGYPSGLKGDQIPISARIVAIVDVFDALIHKRVYKDKIGIEESVEIMIKGRGNHFDPNLLDLFISLKDEMSQIAFDYLNPVSGVDDDHSEFEL